MRHRDEEQQMQATSTLALTLSAIAIHPEGADVPQEPQPAATSEEQGK